MGNFRSKNCVVCYLVLVLVAILALPVFANWQPGQVPLMTKWADEVSPDNVHPEYPRPQMVRKDWLNLNGLWDYAIVPKYEKPPQEYDGKILVPFPAESALSGVTKRVGVDNCLWYRRTIYLPEGWAHKRLLLHFGAVDWDTTVWVNGKKLGEHKGCYDSFSFDISDVLKDGGQEIVLRVWDPTDTGTQPRGKQVTNPKDIYYTPVTGIWQTVWLEPVGQSYIEKIQLVPDIDAGVLFVKVNTNTVGSGLSVEAMVLKDSQPVTIAMGKAGVEFALKIEKPQLWSVDSPFLYGLEISLRDGDKTVDKIGSYFGMRKISVSKDEDGFLRMFLNNKPLFQYGPLDQGWWPDGLYTAATDEALKYDIEVLKMLGFNMMRKHVKIEPARFYYHCDKLGLLVWQDMPNANPHGKLRVRSFDPEDVTRDPESAKQFEAELKAMIDGLANHPSIITWVVFNEGWGQYDTKRLTQWVKLYDSTRLCNATSGWSDRGVSDMYDAHMYPGPGMETISDGRLTVLGEFGGLGLPVKDHLWLDKGSWGYRTYMTTEELAAKYEVLLKGLYGMIGRGLAAAVYTQTTDVESEVNGLMTYDRKILKFDPELMRRLSGRLYEQVPKAVTLLSESEHMAQVWNYSTQKPDGLWKADGYDDSDWQTGVAPFTAKSDAYIGLGTKWAEDELWLRRSFELKGTGKDLRLIVYYNVGIGEVFINGVKVAQVKDRSRRHYQNIDISEHAAVLKKGTNIVAVHCTAGKRGHAFDMGLYSLDIGK